jgi:hypothetical protein
MVRTLVDLTWRIEGRTRTTSCGTVLVCHTPTPEERKRQPSCVVVTIYGARRFIPAHDLEATTDEGAEAIHAASQAVLAPSKARGSETKEAAAARRWAESIVDTYDGPPPTDDWALTQVQRYDVQEIAGVLYGRNMPVGVGAALSVWIRTSAAGREWATAQRAVHERRHLERPANLRPFDLIREDVFAELEAMDQGLSADVRSGGTTVELALAHLRRQRSEPEAAE